MINTILSDFARVVLFPKDNKYKGRLDKLNRELLQKYGHYDFFDYFRLNKELLDYFKSIKQKLSVNILTTGDTQDIIEVRQKIEKIFDNIFVTTDYNLEKTNAQTYIFIADKLKKKPGEILFIDDMLDNIKASKKAGLNAIHYTNNKKLFSQFKEFYL